MKKRDAYLDDEIIPNGGSVKVRMVTMDAVQRRVFDAYKYQSGYRFTTDAAARDAEQRARSTWIKQTTEAWKTDARRRRPKEDDEEVEGAEGQNETDPDEIGQSALSVRSRRGAADARAAATGAYYQMVQRLQDSEHTCDPLALLAALFPDRMLGLVMGEVERMANDPLPVAQRAPRIAALEREQDELHRVEEALVAVAIAAGHSVQRSPAAVLGVRVADRASRAA
jgi:hypothetical protein